MQSFKDQVRAAEADLSGGGPYSSGECRSEYGGVHTRTAVECRSPTQTGPSSTWVHENLRAVEWDGFSACRPRRRNGESRPGDITLVDFSDTWVRAAIPETESDNIGLGDALRIRLPGGTMTSGKVFFKSAEADFATQRDVSRRKRDIRTIVSGFDWTIPRARTCRE